MSKYSWSKYNELNAKLSAKIIKFNTLNKINFIEVGHYNHIRDIFCLAILFNKKINKKTKILDFGSNLLALSNIKSKINVKLYDFFIYDPFYSKKFNNNKKKFNIKFYVDADKIKFNKFDIVFDRESSQGQIFADAGVPNLVKQVVGVSLNFL